MVRGSSTTGRAQGAYLSSINTTGAKPYLLIWRNVKLALLGSVPLVHLYVVFIKTAALGKSMCCGKHLCREGGGGRGGHTYTGSAHGGECKRPYDWKLP